MELKPVIARSCPIVDKFASSPLDLSFDDHEAFQFLKVREPQLVAISDGTQQAPINSLVFRHNKQICGGVSIASFINPMRKEKRNQFSRIDLVIVMKDFRGLGLGRVLCSSAILFMQKAFTDSLYSISCLAGHKAIEKTLVDFGFDVDTGSGHDFSKCTLKVDEANVNSLNQIEDKFMAALQLTNFRIRQKD